MDEKELQMHKQFLQEAVNLARENVATGRGGPFGAVIVRDGQIIARGCNQVLGSQDPTLHAEVDAIRTACKKLNSFDLKDCVIYSSCEPCPMCLGAIYWARPKALFFAADRYTAARHGFDDKFCCQIAVFKQHDSIWKILSQRFRRIYWRHVGGFQHVQSLYCFIV